MPSSSFIHFARSSQSINHSKFALLLLPEFLLPDPNCHLQYFVSLHFPLKVFRKFLPFRAGRRSGPFGRRRCNVPEYSIWSIQVSRNLAAALFIIATLNILSGTFDICRRYRTTKAGVLFTLFGSIVISSFNCFLFSSESIH